MSWRKSFVCRKKLIPEAPHETILVLDSTIGQNALLQAKGFNEVADLTGVALTKLDGSAKGGVVIAVRDSLNYQYNSLGWGRVWKHYRIFIEKHLLMRYY